MGVEIERKFLVTDDAWRRVAVGAPCVQGYLPGSRACGVRVRLMDGQGFLTLKGPLRGGARPEYEYPIPAPDAQELLDGFCIRPLIEKTRYTVRYETHTWTVDVFHGANAGLIVAEIELAAVDEAFPCPPWIGREVTGCPAYSNSRLVQRPYATWKH